MRKIFRLTESDFNRIVRRVINETSEVDEGILDTILKSIKGGSKSGFQTAVSKQLKNVGKGTSKLPLLQQIPSEVKFLIEKLPQNIKVGPKIEGAFKKSMHDVLSLEGGIARLSREVNGLGTAEAFSRRISEVVKKSKGSTINFKELYTDAHLLKKDLQNLKIELPKTAPKGISSKNYQNLLDTEMMQINRFIGNLDELIKNAKIK